MTATRSVVPAWPAGAAVTTARPYACDAAIDRRTVDRPAVRPGRALAGPGRGPIRAAAARRPAARAAAARSRRPRGPAAQTLLGHAADVLSGPGGLAAFLRTGLLGGQAPPASLPLDVGTATSRSRRTCAARSSPATGTARSPAATSPPAACQVHHLIPRVRRRPDQPGQPAPALRLPPPHRRPPVGLDARPAPRRHHHRDQPRPHPHPAQPRPTRPRRLADWLFVLLRPGGPCRRRFQLGVELLVGLLNRQPFEQRAGEAGDERGIAASRAQASSRL